MSLELKNLLQHKSHIIWDWNGTLLNDVPHAVSTMNYLLDSQQLPQLEVNKYKQIFEFPVLHYYNALGFDYSKESFESLCHRFVDKFMEGFRECPLVAGMKEVLHDMRTIVKKQSILSASDQESLNEMVNHFELRKLFDYVFGINDKLASSKLNRGEELIKISNISKEKTVLIGDTIHDLEVADVLGIDVILLSHGHQCSKKLKIRHHHVLDIL